MRLGRSNASPRTRRVRWLALVPIVGLVIGCASEGQERTSSPPRSTTTEVRVGSTTTTTTDMPTSTSINRGPSPMPPLRPPTWPTGAKAADVILRVETSGGFEGLRQPPMLTLYRDGRVVFLNPPTGPSQLPTFDLAQLDPTGIAMVIDAAEAAGLAGPKTLQDPIYPDAFVTSIRVVRGGKAYESTLADGSDTVAHRRAGEFLRQVDDLRTLVGPGNMSATRTVDPQDLAVRVYEDNGGGEDPAQPWPVSGFDLSIAPDGTCRRASGPDADEIIDAVGEQHSAVVWSSGGRSYRVSVDAILPDQPCV